MKKTTARSGLERALLFQIKAKGLPEPVTEFAFAESLGRKFRADMAWVDHKLLLEVQGGGFVGGRHSTGVGLERDACKFSLAAVLGYRVLHCTGAQIERGEAVQWIEQCLQKEETSG